MDSRVGTVVELPDLSEHPLSHLCEDLYEGFALGRYDVLGDRVLADHIGYEARGLESLSALAVRFPGLDGARMSNWTTGLLLVEDAP